MVDPTPSRGAEKQFSWAWLRSRLFPRGMHLLTWASFAVILYVLLELILRPNFPHDSRFYGAIVALSLLLVLNALWDDIRDLFQNHENGNWFFLFASAFLALTSAWMGRNFNALYLVLMIAAQANSTMRTMPALAFTITLAGGLLALFALMGANFETIFSLSTALVLGLIFVGTLSQVLFRYAEQTARANRLLEQLQEANRELVAARQREKELAIAEERVRVARDLHDGLGHHLTALSIQLQAIEKLVRSNPDQASEAARNARTAVQAALKEVRQSVAALREAPVDIQNLPQALTRLVREAGKRSGLQAEFEQHGECESLPPASALTLYRAVQEGLTNIQKHARGATRVTVRLDYTESGVQLLIQDNGQAPPDSLTESATPQPGAAAGFGLAGLRERAKILGGSLSCGPEPQGGFTVRLSIPVPGDPS